MSSIIEYFNANKLNYTASSSQPSQYSRGPYNVFSKDDSLFASRVSPYYWQISFSQPVSIERYIIRAASSWVSYTSSWDISYSNDGNTFNTIRTEKADIKTNTIPFEINPPINCRHFKITARTVTSGVMRLVFSVFDCFVTTQKKKTFVLIRRRIITEILRMLMQSVASA